MALRSSFSALAEIASVLRRNLLRTSLTALSVAWSMFMLALLLGAGRGLENGVAWEFRNKAINSIWVDAWRTSVPFAGNNPGRRVFFDNDDSALLDSLAGIDALSSRLYLERGGRALPESPDGFYVSYGSKHAAFALNAVGPDDYVVERAEVVRGRFINERDMRERRKVAVIGRQVQKSLFGDVDPIGAFIRIQGLAYLVVGEFDDQGGENEVRKVYVPLSTIQLIYKEPETVHQLLFTLSSADVDESRRIETQVRELLGKRHDVSPDDRTGIYTRNFLARFLKLSNVASWINTFVWVVGVGTLLAGVVGVGNIMLIAVAERTKEIGVRKAVGATPLSIMLMIAAEALLITVASGYTGLVAGVAAVEALGSIALEAPFMRQPSVDLKLMFQAGLVLVAAGVLAGLLPALRAARVSTAFALRSGE